MAGSSGTNGSEPRWTVESIDAFDDDQAELELEAVYPRIHLAFTAVRRQFEVLPYLNARKLLETGETWLYRTRDAVGAPALFTYYEIREDELTVCLLAADRAYGHEL